MSLDTPKKLLQKWKDSVAEFDDIKAEANKCTYSAGKFVAKYDAVNVSWYKFEKAAVKRVLEELGELGILKERYRRINK